MVGGDVTSPHVVVVDHHDSYTWNLVHLVAAVTGVLPTVVEHDEVDADEVLAFTHVVLSPGPGHPADPRDFGVECGLSAVIDQRIEIGARLGGVEIDQQLAG